MSKGEPKVEDILKGVNANTEGDEDLENLPSVGDDEDDDDLDVTLPQKKEEPDDEPDNDEPEDDDAEDDDEPEQTASVLEKVAPLSQKLKNADEKIEEARDELKWFREQSKQGKGDLFKDLPNITVGPTRSLYTLSEAEKDSAVEAILESGLDAREKSHRVKMIESNYAKFRDRQERADKLADQRELDINNAEWGKVREAMLDPEEGDPRLEPYVDKISKWIDDELTAKPFLATKLAAGGAEAKANMVVKAIKALKIDQELDGSRKNRPNPEPPKVGNGGKQTVSGKSKPSYTSKQIEKMSLEDFDKHEAAIFKAVKAGRVK